MIDYFYAYPYVVVLFGFVLILFMFPIPEEVILFIGGFLSMSNGNGVWLPTLLAGIIGVIATDYWYYILAKMFGKRLFKIRLVRWILPDTKRRRALKLVRKHGPWAVFIVRFIPGGIRNPTFLACGLAHMRQKNFLLPVIVGASISSQISFWAGYLFSEHLPPIEKVMKVVNGKSAMILGGLILVLLAIYFIGRAIDKKVEGPDLR